jgi:hypothetical protein
MLRARGALACAALVPLIAAIVAVPLASMHGGPQEHLDVTAGAPGNATNEVRWSLDDTEQPTDARPSALPPDHVCAASACSWRYADAAFGAGVEAASRAIRVGHVRRPFRSASSALGLPFPVSLAPGQNVATALSSSMLGSGLFLRAKAHTT